MDSSKKPVLTRMLAFALLALSVLCALAAVATAINLGFIMTRPYSISVVSNLI